MISSYPLPIYVQRFFTDRLLNQLDASPNTVASYRDTFRLLLRFATGELDRAPTDLRVGDLDAALIGRFLTSYEKERGNSVRSRNTRLAAIRSVFKYVAVNEPQLLLHCQQVLAMPSKRYEKRVVDFLLRDEIDALLKARDLTLWFGRRDKVILTVMLQTGLRVSEMISLRVRDIELGTGAHVRCLGKGRKARVTPLRSDSRSELARWLNERQTDDCGFNGSPQHFSFLQLECSSWLIGRGSSFRTRRRRTSGIGGGAENRCARSGRCSTAPRRRSIRCCRGPAGSGLRSGSGQDWL